MKTYMTTTLLALALATPVLAKDLVPFAQVGDWAVLADPNRGNGCVAQVALSDGSTLRMGFDKPGSGTGYIASFNPFWTQFEKGQDYDVTIAFAETSFVGKGRGEELAGMPGVVAEVNNLDLLSEMANAESVNLSAGGPGVDIALKGSFDAIKAAIECQALQK